MNVVHEQDAEKFSECHELIEEAVVTGQCKVSKVDIEVRGPGGETLLIFCVIESAVECVRILIDRGADMEAEDEYGKTALIYAAMRDNSEMIQILLGAGALANHPGRVDGQTAIQWATTLEHFDAVKALRKLGATFETLDKYDQSPLIECAFHDDVEAVQLLLSLGADPFFPNSRGQTALHMAASFGASSVVDVLSKIPGLAEVRDSSSFVAADLLELGEDPDDSN